jgi:hypothetical protein
MQFGYNAMEVFVFIICVHSGYSIIKHMAAGHKELLPKEVLFIESVLFVTWDFSRKQLSCYSMNGWIVVQKLLDTEWVDTRIMHLIHSGEV